MKMPRSAILLLLYYIPYLCYAQGQSGGTFDIPVLPSQFFTRLQHRTETLDEDLTRQTEKYLRRTKHREERLYKKLYRVDSAAAKSLFAGTEDRYEALSQCLEKDTGDGSLHMGGEYNAYSDSLRGMLNFMKSNPNGYQLPQAFQNSLRKLQSLEGKMQTADQIKAYVHERKQRIAQYIQQHSNLSRLLGKDYQGLNQDLYYYSQQVREYKSMLNDPDLLTKKVLAILNRLPAFQAFMKQNSMLAGLFNLPANYGDPSALVGLQTKDQVAALIQQQVSMGGPRGAAALQSSLRSAQSQLDGYKDKLSKLGGGSSDIDMPDFKPNQQKTKTFWRRLEYGMNMQTNRNNYYFPTVTDFGLSVGYKLSERSTVGLGASYKLGWGNGIQHISFSSQGMGIRSFIDIKIKGSFSASGGLEYNYMIPFTNYQQLRRWDMWSKSGLIGLTKTVSLKSRVFKKTKAQLLWDILSYQQVPRTPPVIFRIGYGF